MAEWRRVIVDIEFTDGKHERLTETGGFTYATSTAQDGVLNVWYKSGEHMPTIHVGAYPLCNIRKWREVTHR